MTPTRKQYHRAAFSRTLIYIYIYIYIKSIRCFRLKMHFFRNRDSDGYDTFNAFHGILPTLNKRWGLNKISDLSLRWRYNGHGGVSNHQPHHCLLNRVFGCRSKKTTKLRVTGLCAGNSPGTGEFPAQIASSAENVSIWWRHHVFILFQIAIWCILNCQIDHKIHLFQVMPWRRTCNKIIPWPVKTLFIETYASPGLMGCKSIGD